MTGRNEVRMWRAPAEPGYEAYADSVAVVDDGRIRMQRGGTVIQGTVEDWFRWATPALTLPPVGDEDGQGAPLKAAPAATAWRETQEQTSGWVRRAGPLAHLCDPPQPAAFLGDLWRCHCARLWRVGQACDLCDGPGHGDPMRGQCQVGLSWRPASRWQRIRYWRRP